MLLPFYSLYYCLSTLFFSKFQKKLTVFVVINVLFFNIMVMVLIFSCKMISKMLLIRLVLLKVKDILKKKYSVLLLFFNSARTVGHINQKKKKQNIPINFNTNYVEKLNVYQSAWIIVNFNFNFML